MKRNFSQKISKFSDKLSLACKIRFSASKQICPNPQKQSLVGMVIFFFLFSLLPIANGQDFSKNYIINGNFSLPNVKIRTQYFNFSIPGWECSWLCEIKNCTLSRRYWLPQNKIDSNCIGQVLDLNSNNFNEVATQQIQLTAGNYLLHFNYYYPITSANKKILNVSFNQQAILHVRPQVAASFDVFRFEAQVQAVEGSNQLAFANLGYAADGLGFKINNVSLYRYTDTTLNTFLQAFVEKGKITNSIPGARVMFRNALTFLINFDRLELYIFHNRTYSYNAQQFIRAANDFMNTKSELAINIWNKIKSDAVQSEVKFSNSSNFKAEYIRYQSFDSEYQDMSYADTLNEALIYIFPFLILFVVALNLLFNFLFHISISLLFRKFSLWAIIIIMTFQGSIQNLTFSTFAEFKTLFSRCFQHKIFNVFIVFLFFVVMFTVFGLLHWGKFHYGKKVKYLLDEQKSRSQLIWGIMVDRGIICLLFGIFHQLLLNVPDWQLFALFFLEMFWVVKKIIFITKGFYGEQWLIVASILNGLGRVCFQVSCYLYQSFPHLRIFINQYIDTYLIYTIVGLVLFELLIGICYCVKTLLKICMIGATNRVMNYHRSRHMHPIPIKPIPLPKIVKISLPQGQNKGSDCNQAELIFYLRQHKSKLTTPSKPTKASKISKDKSMVPRRYNIRRNQS